VRELIKGIKSVQENLAEKKVRKRNKILFRSRTLWAVWRGRRGLKSEPIMCPHYRQTLIRKAQTQEKCCYGQRGELYKRKGYLRLKRYASRCLMVPRIEVLQYLNGDIT